MVRPILEALLLRTSFVKMSDCRKVTVALPETYCDLSLNLWPQLSETFTGWHLKITKRPSRNPRNSRGEAKTKKRGRQPLHPSAIYGSRPDTLGVWLKHLVAHTFPFPPGVSRAQRTFFAPCWAGKNATRSTTGSRLEPLERQH